MHTCFCQIYLSCAILTVLLSCKFHLCLFSTTYAKIKLLFAYKMYITCQTFCQCVFPSFLILKRAATSVCAENLTTFLPLGRYYLFIYFIKLTMQNI